MNSFLLVVHLKKFVSDFLVDFINFLWFSYIDTDFYKKNAFGFSPT